MPQTLGKCMTMCPSAEIVMREREKLLHPLEAVKGTERQKYPKADINRVVKNYIRSAAGIDLTNPEQLRPPQVLYKTVTYLLTDVLHDTRFVFACVDDFITNRFRSISQDIVIQQIEASECIKIYEPIVKYHIYSAYRLCEENVANYDPVLNKKYLMEHLNRLIVCYDDFVLSMKHLSINESFPNSNNRSLIEAIYILVNLGKNEPLLRYFNIPVKYRNSVLNTAFKLAVYHMVGNYFKVVELILKLPELALCAVAPQLPMIRKNALRIMSVAYNSKNLTYPTSAIKTLLFYNRDSDVIEDCKHYGLKATNEEICFQKELFKEDTPMTSPKRIDILETKLKQQNLTDLILGRIKDGSFQ